MLCSAPSLGRERSWWAAKGRTWQSLKQNFLLQNVMLHSPLGPVLFWVLFCFPKGAAQPCHFLSAEYCELCLPSPFSCCFSLQNHLWQRKKGRGKILVFHFLNHFQHPGLSAQPPGPSAEPQVSAPCVPHVSFTSPVWGCWHF